MTEMIRVAGLSKSFGDLIAVDRLSLTVHSGEILGFLGPNGAGKSTTMRMITGFLDPTAGDITVCGHDVLRNPIAARARMGYLPEGAPLYGDITPAALMSFVAGTRGLTGAERRRRIDEAVGKLAISDVMYRPIETLSKGYKRRVALAQAIMHDPDVLILDEPTDGLDPNQKRQVRDLIRDMGRDKAIVISTHILEEVASVCTRAVIIAHGKIVFDGTPGELEATSERHNTVCIHLAGERLTAVRHLVEALPGVERVDVDESSQPNVVMHIVPRGRHSIVQDVSAALRQNEIPIEGLFVEHGHLDEVFHRLTVGK